MAKLEGLIPKQQYELVRDQLAIVLVDELANQKALGMDELSVWDEKVWIDRVKPFEDFNNVTINVTLASGDYDNETIKSSNGTYIFNIDVTARAKEKQSDESYADLDANKILDRVVGAIRAILKNPEYNTLGFVKPSLSHVTVRGFVKGLSGTDEATSAKIARIEYAVRVVEGVELKTGIPIGSHYTTVKLSDTDKGYCWEYVADEVVYYVSQNDEYFVNQEGELFIQN